MSDDGWNDMAYLYGFQCGQWIKVGITQNVARRLKQMRLHNPYPITIVMRRPVLARHARRVEILVHRCLQRHAVGREWFTASIEDIKRYATAAIRAAIDVEREQLADYDEKEDAPPPVCSDVESAPISDNHLI
jgi:hypothetical protein